MSRQVHLLNVGIHNITMTELLESLRGGGVVFTPNVDHVMKLQRDRDFYSVYQQADYRVCDSQILMYVSRFLGIPLREKISGADLLPAFCKYYQQDENVKIFLLGAAPGVAQQAQELINTKVGREMVVGTYSPSFGFEKNEAENQKIVKMINASGATVLAIGVGAPKQEKWITRYKQRLKHVKIYLAVGAAIDFEAENIKRSPQWVSEVGFEWLYRLACEPQRLWKRYVGDALPFFWLVFKQRLQIYTNPWAKLKSSKPNLPAIPDS